MTLTTRVAIGAATNVHELFAYCQTLVHTPPGVEPNRSDCSNGTVLANPHDIGATAVLTITYDFNATEGGDENSDNPVENGWAALCVSFDYSGGDDRYQLTANLVDTLGGWLDVRGLPWKWCDERTGQWLDQCDGLAQFSMIGKRCER